MGLNKSLVLISTLSLLTLGGLAASPALADIPYRDYKIHREPQIHRAQETLRREYRP